MEFAYLRTLLLLLIAASGAAVADSFFPPKFIEVDVQDGNALWLNCSVSEAGPAKWTFQNEKLTPSLAKIFKNGTVLVQRTNMGHVGIWSCVRGTQMIRYSVAIIAKARVFKVDVQPGKNVSRGTQLQITCKGYGSLPRKWRWFKDGAPLLYPDGRPIESDMNSVRLRLNRSARVECEVRNQFGKHRSAVTIFVSNALPPKQRTTIKPAPTTTTPRPVQCLLYLGSVCKPWLPSKHKWAFGGSAKATFDLGWRERAAEALLGAVEAAGPFRKENATCGEGLRALLCGLVFPACTLGPRRSGGRPWKPGQLCREHCVAVDRLFCPRGLASRILDLVRDRLKARPDQRALVPPPGAALCSGLPQGSRIQATGVVQEEADTPLCTGVRLEKEVDQESVVKVCYKGRGQDYRGSTAHFRASRTGPQQPCASWVGKHARAVLENEGYSLEAFPSLAGSGQACRNPAGIKKWPFCVPENPTRKMLVRCDIVSCSEILAPPPDPSVIQLLGLRLAWSKFAVILGVLLFVTLSLFIFLLYCCCCRHILGSRRSRQLRAKNRLNEGDIPLTNASPSVVNSEYDVSDPKSSLLTPNQDYHGKALADYINPKLQKLEYPREAIVDLKELGRGAFGEVFLVEAPPPEEVRSSRRSEGEGSRVRMAMKVLKSDATPETQVQFLREASLLADLNHDNIVRLIGVSLIYKPFCMLMDYMCHGDLNSYLRRHDPNNTAMRVDIDQAAVAMHAHPSAACNGHVGGSASVSSGAPSDELNRFVLCQMAIEIAEGMIYLSHQNYVHRDLATRNCLLDINKKVKIADFGLCRHIKRGEDFIDDDHGAMPVRWMPLEAILERRFNLDTDVWSFGVLLWELFSFALQPYFGKGHEEVIAFLQKGSVLDKPPDAPDAIYVLMLRCWSRQRRDRPPFAFLKRQLSELLRRWTAANHVA